MLHCDHSLTLTKGVNIHSAPEGQFSRGVDTSTDNAALLCGVHHRYVHAHNLTGTRTPDGTIIWHTPTGTHNPHTPPPALTRAINNLAKRWHERNPQPRTNTP